jgi:hypothetical protein
LLESRGHAQIPANNFFEGTVMHRLTAAVLTCLLVALAPTRFVAAQSLDDLTLVREGRSRRVSSASPNPTSNADNRWIKPGETYVMADIDGPAVIHHIWMTFAEAAPGWLAKDGSANPSEVVLRMYWDECDQPAVESPIGDFFAAGFGVRAEVNSAPVQVQGGDAYNCYWPMPFSRRAKITVTNESTKPFSALYYHIDYTTGPRPPDTAYFCAQYRQEFPEQMGRDYLIAEIEGRGHYVGTVMSARSRSPEWFGEGDDKFTIDGEDKPSIWGTGTEDYFLSAWGLEKCSFPYFGVPFLEGDWGDVGTRVCAYRWHIADPVRFSKSLRVEIEHRGWISADESASGKREGHVEREDDVATVAFWYQTGQPKRFTTLPTAKEREFPNLDVVIEGKALNAGARHSDGEVSIQNGYAWTGDGQLFFVPRESPAESATQRAALSTQHWMEFDFNVEKAEFRRVVLRATQSYDYGVFRVLLDGKPAIERLDLYSKDIEVHDHSLGDHELAAGKHTIRIECIDRNPQSTSRRLGVDSVRLRQRWLTKRVMPPG